jgi:hypothetical protein
MGDNWKIRAKDRVIGRAGSYLKAYEKGVRSYAVDGMYRPSSLGFLQVVVTPFRKQVGTGKQAIEERGIKLRAVI